MKRIFIAISLFLATAAASIPAVAEPALAEVNAAESHLVKPVAGGIELTVTPSAQGASRFEVFGITGQQVTSVSVQPGDTRTVQLRPGCYIVRAVDSAGRPSSKRLTVR